jgi:DnaK suppressor protein
MRRAELERFRQILTATLKQMGQPLDRRDEIAIENAPDDLDRIQGVVERELAIRQIESNFSTIQSVQLALERINDGSYGTCQECEEEISPKRLQAVPWACCCVKCQELADQKRINLEREEDGIPQQMRGAG